MTARCVLFIFLGAALAPTTAGAACPTITRDKVISIAKSGVGCKYVWGGTCWNPKNKAWKGADCSGYVTVCWQVPKASSSTSCLPHYYTTYSYKNTSTHWSSISRNGLLKADALVYNTGSKGHIVLYSSGNKWGNAMVYEAMGTAYGIRYRTRYVTSNYVARRRHRIGSAKPKYPVNNVKGYQKQNGGNLHAYTQTDVLSKEVCDKKDNDCDGTVDEGVCSKPKPKPKPKKDAGAPAPVPDKGAPKAPDRGAPDGWDPEPPAGGDAWIGGDLPSQASGGGPATASGGCAVGSPAPTNTLMMLLLLLGLAWRSRPTR